MAVLNTYLSPSRQGGPAKAVVKPGDRSPGRDIRELISIFWSWKVLLLLVACVAPGPGYDTSSGILLNGYGGQTPETPWFARGVEQVILKLTRWDAIYFATTSERGHQYEQEWAFSWALSHVTWATSKLIPFTSYLSPIAKQALAGIVISHSSHLLVVMALYSLVHESVPAGRLVKSRIAFTSACLHIISPAGIFLSAPCAESTFALLNVMAMLSYVWAAQAHAKQTRAHSHHRKSYSWAPEASTEHAFWSIMAGFWFGLASTVRSNGLLNGVIFVWDAFEGVQKLWQAKRKRRWEEVPGLLGTFGGGTLVAVGFALPQVVAYIEYCTGGNTRPWCIRLPPSIYTWVQEHYWEVGFMKYWTASNIPLFVLAVPMLWLLVLTSLSSLLQANKIIDIVQKDDARPQSTVRKANAMADSNVDVARRVLGRFALPQLLVAVLAFTSFHVQIVNRISSGYPLWYLVLAIAIHTPDYVPSSGDKDQTYRYLFRVLQGKRLEWIVRGMIIYATVQSGLYASFLPPA